MKRKARVIAFYLPQFHPIPENDENWGKGFTEWTNVASAKPLWKGHHQPRVPADLGFYDLRLPQVREAQAQMAKEAGVESFMYWHYWFGDGKMLLEKPAEWLLQTGKPDFPFCFGWANHDWSTKTWTKNKMVPKMIAEMKYLGTEDNRKHFEYCLPFFKDHRYTLIEGRPVFVIYEPNSFVGLQQFMDEWNIWAKEAGLKGIYFIGTIKNNVHCSYERVKAQGFDGACNTYRMAAEAKATGSLFLRRLKAKFAEVFSLATNVYEYSKVMENFFNKENDNIDCFPSIMPGADHTARRGKKGIIYKNPTPQAFQQHIHKTIEQISHKDFDHRVIFLNSWNEWGEGNYVEPDTKWGHAYLDAIKNEVFE